MPKSNYTQLLSTTTPFFPQVKPILFEITVDKRHFHQDTEQPYPYPPPILTKRPQWYLPHADRFISVRGALYGLHHYHFPWGSFFTSLQPPKVLDGEFIPRGLVPEIPIPIDDITYIEFEEFLVFLCYPDEFYGNEDRWRRVLLLASRWRFLALQHRAYMELQYLRYRYLPPLHRQFMMSLTPTPIHKAFRRRHQPLLVVESDFEDVISDD
jgi:hypothetical protein